MTTEFPQFPKGFVFGTATSSYQIEGAAAVDGRTPSIWDRFCDTPGKIVDGSNGAVACDHYHRFAEDVGLMRELGLRGYRFSVAWPRIIPAPGVVNEQGLDFYDRLVDTLLEAGITPFATLYHWDLPIWLEDQGGWRTRDSVGLFAEYTDVVARRLGDRVKHWMTHNEPWCTSFLGHALGVHAPGDQDVATALRVAHHVLLSHGAAVPLIRAASPGSEVGIAPNFSPAQPVTDSPADQAAARRHDGFFNRWFLEPILGRGYPADMVELYGALVPQIEPGDMEQIAVPIDYLGVNFYSEDRHADAPDQPPLYVRMVPPEGDDVTTMAWPVTPDGLERLLVRLHAEYQVPKIYITENGCAYPDAPSVDGQVRDPLRKIYLQKHFAAAARAIEQSAPLAGFFVWSFLDNFEWALGYTQRFGIVYTDYATQQRTLKLSARWYKELIAANS